MQTNIDIKKSSKGTLGITHMKVTENSTVKAIETLIKVLPQGELPIDHFFSDGLYARKMTMPASTILTGKTHNHNHLAILLKGEVAVHSRQGTAVYKAPYVVNVVAGDKRAFFSVTEVEWITIHATEETDITKLENELAGE